MATGPTIKIRRSATAGKVPKTTDLALGELAINTADGKIFLKKLFFGQESIVTFEKQLTAGTGVTIVAGEINIGQDVGTDKSPTFAGITLNDTAVINQSGTGTQNSLKVAGAGSGSVFTVGVSNTAADGINLKSLTSDLTNPAKITISGSSVVLKSGTKLLTFNDSGKIVLPTDGDIVNSKNESVLKYPSVKKITFDNPISYVYGTLNFTNVTATDSNNNYITVDDSSIFAVNSPVIFYGLVSFGGIKKSLQYPDITTYFVKSIVDSTTITISETTDVQTGMPGPTFNLSNGTGQMIISTNILPLNKTVVAFNGNNNYITLDSSSGLNVGDPITFICSPVFDEYGSAIFAYGNIEMNSVYYVRSIPNSESITVTNQQGSNIDVVLSTTTDFPIITLTLLSSKSYQLHRAPRLFTPFDSLETTGYDLTSMTYGDLFYRESHLYVMVDLGYGTPQPMDLTPPS